MITQKSQKATVARKAPIQVDIDLRNSARVIDSEVNYADELTIDKDYESGGDPYNTTGSHMIIKQEKDADE